MADPHGGHDPGRPVGPIPPDQEQRERILTELDRNLLVEAAAGTGKTTSMVGRMAALIGTGRCPHVGSLAAVTFTRKAAAELRGRFQLRLEAAARQAVGAEKERLEQALSSLEQCFVGTIHSFCARLLRERPVEAGVDVSFRELDEEEDDLLRREAWEAFTARLAGDDPEGLAGDLARLGLDPADLEGAWLRFADYPDVDEWPVPPDGELLPSFEAGQASVRAYVEHMQRLFPRLPDEWGTDRLIPEYRRLPRILAHYEDLGDPAELMDFLELFEKSPRFTQKPWKAAGFTPEEAKAEDARWKDFRREVVDPLFRAWRELRYGPSMRALHGAREVYDGLRRARGLLNFQDLLLRAASLLRDHPHVRAYFQDRFRFLLVDEFQDTDPIQAEVMLLLTATDPGETDWRRCTARPGALFVVGDPKQSIYRFRRADIVTYNEVKEIIRAGGGPGAEGDVVQLSANFRASRPVIEWVNRVFEAAEPEEDGGPMLRFPETASDESPAYVALEPGREDGNAGTLDGIHALRLPPEHTQIDGAVGYEADRIARTIRHALDTRATVTRTDGEIRQGRPPEVDPSDFLIVTRNRPDLSRYASALQACGVPHHVSGGSALNEVKALHLLHTGLKAVVRPEDPVALVAALRSELFGLSDADLYAFKKAGGTFSYREDLPAAADPGGPEPDPRLLPLRETFLRLRRHARWLATLPPLSALERIVADLGIPALAAAAEGGDVEAGSVAKALEVLRETQRETWSPAQLVEHLGRIVEREQPHDGISARSAETPAVRIMNLHKVKGLEAPVVFLANPRGESDHGVQLHVDRSGDRVLGYMVVPGKVRRYGRAPTLAHPARWEELKEREGRYERAEALRLRYVAATRAGAALIVTQREGKGKNRTNPWQFFDPYLPEDEGIPDPGPQPAPTREERTVAPGEADRACEAVAERLLRVQRPTLAAKAARVFAMAAAGEGEEERRVEGSPAPAEAEVRTDTDPGGEHGVEWGTALHQLLEVAMGNPRADLLRLAGSILAEQGLDADRAPAAVDAVRAVMGSEIWKRARASDLRFTEVPFQRLMAPQGDAGPPTLVRGVIDLVFREADGWVLVDYKTDRLRGAGAEALVERYAPQVRLYAESWAACTGEQVKEAALYFLREDRLEPV